VSYSSNENSYIYPHSERIQKLRKNIVELVLTDHPLDCLTCEVNNNCELQTVAAKVGVRDVRYAPGKNHLDRKKDLSHAYMTSDLSKCINCSRCVRACDEVQGQFVLTMAGRGFDAHIVKGMDQTFEQSDCVVAVRVRRLALHQQSLIFSNQNPLPMFRRHARYVRIAA
jgi:formate dehydrogenase major subunit